MEVKDAKGLGEAIKENAELIEIEGDLAKKVIKIKATGKAAWAVAIGAIAVAIVGIALIPASGGVSAPASGVIEFISVPTAAIALGGSGFASIAVTIALAGGGIGALNKFRKYKLEKLSNDKIRLIRK